MSCKVLSTFVNTVVRQKINPEKCSDSVFGLLDLQLMKIAHISCIFCIRFAVFTEYGMTSIQTKQSPVIFVQQFPFLSKKNFQSVEQLSGNISEDSAKTGPTCKFKIGDVYSKDLGEWKSLDLIISPVIQHNYLFHN